MGIFLTQKWENKMSFTKISQNDADGSAVVNAGYVEPIGQTDLALTTIYIRVNNGSWTPIIVPATSPNGGGSISKDITVGLPVEDNTIEAYVTATDLVGNEGAQTPTKSLSIVSDVTPPGTVTGF